MKSKLGVAKHSIVIAGHKTSVSLEEPFWQGLKETASKKEMTLSVLVESIEIERVKKGQVNLSSAIRLYVLKQYAPPRLFAATNGSSRPDAEVVHSQS